MLDAPPEALIASMLGAPATPGTVRTMLRWAGSDRSLLTALLAAGRTSGALVPVAGGAGWQWSGPLVATEELRSVLAEAVDGLTAGQQLALQAAALAGECPLDLLLGALAEGGPGDLAALEEAGLVASSPVGGSLLVAVVRPLVADLTVASLLPLRRRELSARLLRAQQALLAGREPAGVEAVRLARYARGAGAEVGVEVLLQAARALLARQETDEAEALARAALGSGGFTARWLLADALFQQGRYAEVEAELATAFAAGGAGAGGGAGGSAGGGDDLAARAAALRLRARNLAEGLRDRPAALAVLHGAGSVGVADVDARLPDVLAAAAALARGDATSAYEEAARLVGDPRAGLAVRAEAGPVFLAAAHLTGRGRTALALYDSVLAPAVRGGSTEDSALALALARAEALIAVGDLAGCERHVDELDVAATARPAVAAVAALARGQLLLAEGRPRRASALLLEAERLLRNAGDQGGLCRCLATQARACGLLGDLDAARLHLAAATAAMRSRHDEVTVAAAATWVHAAAGDLGRARDAATRRCRDATRTAMPWAHLLAVHDLARLEGVAHAQRALAAVGPVEGVWAEAAVTHVAALATDDPEGLEGAEAVFRSLRLHVEAWECAARLAVLHQRAGRVAAARMAGERVAALRRDCDDVRTPGTTSSLLADVLTLREREVAALVARGLRSSEVAEQLGVSVRTVESHLYHAYAKLGVVDRAGLISALRGS